MISKFRIERSRLHAHVLGSVAQLQGECSGSVLGASSRLDALEAVLGFIEVFESGNGAKDISAARRQGKAHCALLLACCFRQFGVGVAFEKGFINIHGC